jgi:hypothetical protein
MFFLNVLVSGLLAGLMYGMVAIGFVLIYTFIDWRGLSTVSAAAAKLGLKPLRLLRSRRVSSSIAVGLTVGWSLRPRRSSESSDEAPG